MLSRKFFPKSCLKVGGAAYTRVRLIHKCLRYFFLEACQISCNYFSCHRHFNSHALIHVWLILQSLILVGRNWLPITVDQCKDNSFFFLKWNSNSLFTYMVWQLGRIFINIIPEKIKKNLVKIIFFIARSIAKCLNNIKASNSPVTFNDQLKKLKSADWHII